jgi:hypothetical protein
MILILIRLPLVSNHHFFVSPYSAFSSSNSLFLALARLPIRCFWPFYAFLFAVLGPVFALYFFFGYLFYLAFCAQLCRCTLTVLLQIKPHGFIPVGPILQRHSDLNQ